MNLSDRLAQRHPVPDHNGQPAAGRDGPRAVRHTDPFAAVKRSVHQALLATLGPTLYDAHVDQRELAARVRQTLQTVLEQEDTPLTAADRNQVAQDVADEILGHGPLEPYLRDSDVSEIMVNGHDQPTRAASAGPSTRSSHGWAGGWTRPARWSTPGCQTAAGSTRWFRRSRWTARC